MAIERIISSVLGKTEPQDMPQDEPVLFSASRCLAVSCTLFTTGISLVAAKLLIGAYAAERDAR